MKESPFSRVKESHLRQFTYLLWCSLQKQILWISKFLPMTNLGRERDKISTSNRDGDDSNHQSLMSSTYYVPGTCATSLIRTTLASRYPCEMGHSNLQYINEKNEVHVHVKSCRTRIWITCSKKKKKKYLKWHCCQAGEVTVWSGSGLRLWAVVLNLAARCNYLRRLPGEVRPHGGWFNWSGSCPGNSNGQSKPKSSVCRHREWCMAHLKGV